MSTYRVGYLVGNLPSTSIHKVLSSALITCARRARGHRDPIGKLSPHGPDLDADYPPEARALIKAIVASDAVVFISPEYNRSISGALRNATSSSPTLAGAYAQRDSSQVDWRHSRVEAR